MEVIVEYENCKLELREDEDVIIRSGISSKNLDLAKLVVDSKTVKSLLHYRDEKSVKYQTVLHLKNGYTVLIDGGITSGYVGSGPSAFKELLVHIGIDEKRAEDIAEIEMRKISQGTVTIDFF